MPPAGPDVLRAFHFQQNTCMRTRAEALIGEYDSTVSTNAEFLGFIANLEFLKKNCGTTALWRRGSLPHSWSDE